MLGAAADAATARERQEKMGREKQDKQSAALELDEAYGLLAPAHRRLSVAQMNRAIREHARARDARSKKEGMEGEE